MNTQESKKIAQEYLLGVLTSLKQTVKKRESTEQELTRWRERLVLAQKHQRPDLEAGAQDKISRLELDLQALREEEREMAREAEKARAEYKTAGLTARSVNTDYLLAELRMLAGKNPDGTAPEGKKDDDPLNTAIKELSLEQELETLKQTIKKETSSNEQT